MACAESFKGYLSYKCYEDIKYQFGQKIKERSYEISSYIEEFEKTYADNKLQKLNQLSDVFTNLKKYLSNSHVFIYLSDKYNGDGTCNYISYLLYDGIRNKKNGECDEQTFNDFKEFVDSYNASRSSNMCRGMLKHFNSDEFRKREALYKLYDMYYDLDSKKDMKNPENICSILQSLIFNYNKFNEIFYEKDEELLEKLKNLKPLIEQHKWVSNHECDASLSNLRTLKSDFLEREKQRKIQGEATTLTHLPNQSSDIWIEREGKIINKPAEGEPQRLDVTEGQLEGRGHESKVTELELRVVPPTRRVDVQTAVVGPTGMSGEGKTFLERTIYQYSDHKDNLELTKPLDKYETYLEPHDRNDTVYPPINSNDQEGVLETMKNALSSIVKDVEPGPVLGVSGGMGALFLLFKYTPVGSFFGGRRGRIRQIPSSFRGFPPDFANFQEYGGGYVGYSPMDINPLAE